MNIIKAQLTESEFYEMKAAKHHCREVKATYEALIEDPTDEPPVQIPESLWKVIETIINDGTIRADLHK